MNQLKNTQGEISSEKPKRKNFFVGLFTNFKQLAVFLLSLLILPALFVGYAYLISTESYKPAAEIGGSKEPVTVSIDASQQTEVQKIIQLEKENNFEKNRLDLANQDSIYMIVDIPARKIAIEIKGVQVRTASILRVEMDQKLALFSHERLSPWLSEPFNLKKHISTIPKIPIVVKDAPKDTIEAQKISTKPLPPDSSVVYTSLYFNKNLILEINQDALPQERELPKVQEYFAKTLEISPKVPAWTNLLNPGSTDQPLTIKIIVSAPDARAIYRAIPSRTNMVMKL
jgi:hypothetical protein